MISPTPFAVSVSPLEAAAGGLDLFDFGIESCSTPRPGDFAYARELVRHRIRRHSSRRGAYPSLQRGAFLKAMAVELERHRVIGPGLVHRCVADLQRTFLVTGHIETALTLSRDPSRRPAAGRAA